MNQSKKICLNQFITMSEYTPFVPRDISWSQNSCGYDAALTIYIQYGVEILKDGLKTSEGSEIHTYGRL